MHRFAPVSIIPVTPISPYQPVPLRTRSPLSAGKRRNDAKCGGELWSIELWGKCRLQISRSPSDPAPGSGATHLNKREEGVHLERLEVVPRAKDELVHALLRRALGERVAAAGGVRRSASSAHKSLSPSLSESRRLSSIYYLSGLVLPCPHTTCAPSGRRSGQMRGMGGTTSPGGRGR